MGTKFLLAASAALAIGAAWPAAHANILVPGGSVTPDNLSFAGPQLATTGIVSFTSQPNGLLTGKLVEDVVSNPDNHFGAGDITFLIQVQNTSSLDDIGRVTATSFRGFQTDVGLADGPCAGYSFIVCGPAPPNNPATIDRNSAGDVVGFNFNTGVLPPGATSFVLQIDTDARNFTAGELSAIDGETGTILAYEPVPGPIVGAGLPGLITAAGAIMAWGRRRRTGRMSLTAA